METEIAQTAVVAGPTMVEMLIDYGALGIMVVFLAWQHLQMTKRQREDHQSSQDRNDKLVDRFETQLADIQKKYEEREDSLRQRYDTVIADLNSNRDTLKNEIHGGLTGATSKLDTVLAKLDEGLTEIRDMRQQETIRRIQREAGGSGTTQQ